MSEIMDAHAHPVPKMEPVIWEDHQTPRGHNMLDLGVPPHTNPMAGMSTGHLQYERNLNFAIGAVEENDYGFPKKKTVRDPLSHRIIEKRRRDRMNNCLADLARLLPPSSLRKGRGRIEKTEIVELAIKHLRHLQCHPCPSGDKCEFNYIVKQGAHQENFIPNLGGIKQQIQPSGTVSIAGTATDEKPTAFPSTPEEHFRLGYHECMSEIMHFLVEEEGMYPGDSMCIRVLKHLRTHSETLMREHFGKEGKLRFPDEVQKKDDTRKMMSDSVSDINVGSSNSSSGYQANGSSSGSDMAGGQDAESPPTPGPNNLTKGTISNTERSTGAMHLEYEGENSCSSTQLSLDISDVFSTDSKTTMRSSGSKPPIPTIICSNSSIASSPPVPTNSCGRSSDEGQDGNDMPSSTSSSHRYKFKNNIKQRFTADLSPAFPDEKQGNEENHSHSPRPSFVTKASLKESQQDEVGDPTSDIDDDEGRSLRDGEVICLAKNNLASSEPLHTSGEIMVKCLPEVSKSQKLLEKVSDPETKLSKNKSKEGKFLDPITSLGESTGGKSLGVGVPAFALHEKGLFYIPLTIDKSSLTPYLNNLDTCQTPPLHPVTISVCFLLPEHDKEKAHPSRSLDTIPPFNTNPTPSDFRERLTPVPEALPLVIPQKVSIVPGTSYHHQHHHTKGSSKSCLTVSKDGNNPASVPHFRKNSPSSYRYPVVSSVTSPSHDHQHQQLLSQQHNIISKDLMSHPHLHSIRQYYPHSPSFPSQQEGIGKPSHINGGYSSSGSSSASSSERQSRKRSLASLSPNSAASGASSLGYHSYHDKFEKYQPSVSFNGFSENGHHNFGAGSHSHYHGPPAVIPFHTHNAFPSHLLQFSEEKHGDMPGRRSPSKRSKKGQRESEDLMKHKPHHNGLPMIPLPPN